MSKPTLVVLGSGPGIGVSTASLFAEKAAFEKIILTSRNTKRLGEDRDRVLEAAKQGGKQVDVETITSDLSNLNELKKTLQKIEQAGPLGCLFFNGARVAESKLLETPVEDIELDFRTTNLALYEVARWAIPLLKQNAAGVSSPSFFVTNSLLYQEPIPEVFSLSLTKAAQRSMVLSLHATFGEDVHIAVVSVEGPVADDKPNMNPPFIAGKVWDLYQQPKGQWKRDMEILN